MSYIDYPNGVKLDVEEMPELNTATICIDLVGGVQGEAQLHNGMCEMIARLLMCGTTNHPSPALILDEAKNNGLVVSVTAKMEFLEIKINCLKNKVNEAIEFSSEILFTSLFEEKYISLLKKQLQSEAALSRMNPNTFLSALTNQSMFARTGLANVKCGNVKSVERISREKLLEQFARYISPKNISIAIGGAVNSEEVIEKIGNLFYTSRPEEVYKQIKFVSKVKNADGFVNIKKRKFNQSRVDIAFPSYSYKDDEALIMPVIGEIVETRIKQALNDENYFKSIDVKNIVYANNGKFVLSIAVDGENAERFIEQVLRTLQEIKNNSLIISQTFEAEKQAYLTKFVKTYEEEENLTVKCAEMLTIVKFPFNLSDAFDFISSFDAKGAVECYNKVINFSKINIAYLGEPIALEFLGSFISENM